ncbi:MAG TPA: FAD-binding oxidoreductase [Levilinea sp.]|nr:FAD-binding oxidoreductase [Levilinea sp.]
MEKREKITPRWYEQRRPERSYRSLFKWGDPVGFKHPNRGLVELAREVFGMKDEDFAQPVNLSLEAFEREIPVKLAEQQIARMREVVGAENVTTDTYARTRVSYGGGMIDALRLRKKIIENLPDVVVAPRNRADVEAIVRYCNEQRIPLYVYGGGSSVTRGMEAVAGGVTLDMAQYMNRVIAFHEIDQTITVQPGMLGPALEQLLNRAPEEFGARRRYTCGHFPQSFEYSSVGGWVVTRGAGQNSTYYGKIEDIVLAQEYVTPVGVITTPPFPRTATGPDIDQVMMGSEGCFGVLTAVTLRVFRYLPHNRRRFAYLFKDWDTSLSACREILQAEFGFPSVFRLSDPEETGVAMRMYNIHNTPADTFLRTLGYYPMQRCLLLGSVDGEGGFSRLVQRKLHAVCRQHRAFALTPFGVTQRWEHSRFRDPYMREDLQDFGILTDTLECAVAWSQLKEVHARVRACVKSHPQTVCMTHLSHAYPQGANLYFIFIARIDSIHEYLKLQYAILQTIQEAGAAMSHHHGIGKQTAPWFYEQIGETGMGLLQAIKRYFDPHDILNPGGTLGLDMRLEQRAKIWGLELEDDRISPD